jgi:SpoVK/Ycf46/Vps4 family AAA+-type ATPase
MLSESLVQKNLEAMQSRLEEKGLPKGIAVILYGAPGTGKTETAYQLARQTKRKILHVDIAESKSMWFGESEKKIKKIFTDYRMLCKSCRRHRENTPILLFNEADSIFGKRLTQVQHSVDQMLNTMQNIILQEMESLDGILIATTNLTENLDDAFDRRFLYKIKFDKPTEEARASIWRSMIPDLSELDVHTLASKYDFSGGQIENIARHYAIDNILHDRGEDVLSMLIRHCDNERLDDKEQKKIGF